MTRWNANVVLAVLGATVYAAAGAVMGSANAGWLDLDQGTNAVLPALGIGAGLLVAAFRSSELYRQIMKMGGLGQAAKYLLLAGPLLYVVSWFIEFAIFGTLAVAFGLICLAVAAWRGRVAGIFDRVLISLSAAGSLTWNTETVSAFFLVGVGFTWLILSIRLLPAAGEGGDDV